MSEDAAAFERIPPAHRDQIESVLLPAEQISAKLDELAAEISADYAGEDLLLVAILKGAICVVSDLHRRLTIPASVDFMAVSSYGSATTSSGVVRILKDLDTQIDGRHVLLVEDIVDSGLTLNYLMKYLRSRGPASVEVCSLLTKPERREVDLPIRYVGFEVPDVFVVGYGLDFDEQFRGLADIVTLKPEVYQGT